METQKQANRFHYRPEIDGLRAIAVLLVVLFHLDLGFAGGYIGVDVFFVISGYLIGSIITRDLTNGEFKLSTFWERRIRRIMPACLAMIGVSTLLGAAILLPNDFRQLGASVIAQAAMLANVFFWKNTGYFAGDAEENPLLHMWSLAVEEQFYILLPFALIWCYRGRHPNRRLHAACGITAALSFAASVYAVNNHPVAAFYLIPFRSWELLLGVLLSTAKKPPLMSRSAEVISLGGIAVIILTGWNYTQSTPFPGIYAAVPCIATCAFIFANIGDGSAPPTHSGIVLASPPLTLLGKASYSIYLWHWPLVVYCKYVSPLKLHVSDRLAIFGVSLIAGFLSWKLIESPFRRSGGGTARHVITSGVTATCISALVGFLILSTNGFEGRYDATVLKLEQAKNDIGFVFETFEEDVRSDDLPRLGLSSEESSEVLIWGDSHAMAMLPVFDEMLKAAGLNARVATHSSTAPVFEWYAQTKYGLDSDAISYGEELLALIREKRVKLVIMNCFWEKYRSQDNAGFTEALLKTVDRLKKSDVQVWIILDVPRQPFDVPTAIARAKASGKSIEGYLTTPEKLGGLSSCPTLLEELRARHILITDPSPLFLSQDGRRYIVEKDGKVLYRDDQHLTREGALQILTPALSPIFDTLIKQVRPST